MIHIFTVDRAIELGQVWADGIVKSSTGATSILPQGVRGSEWATLFASEPSGELLEETHARPSPGKCGLLVRGSGTWAEHVLCES